MSEEQSATVEKKKADVDAAAPLASEPALIVKSINVVKDPHNKSPGGLPMDIVELELYPAGQGNGPWMQWRDLARFSCERGMAEKVIVALGLKVGA